MDQTAVKQVLRRASERIASAVSQQHWQPGNTRVCLRTALSEDMLSGAAVSPDAARAVCAAVSELWPEMYGQNATIAMIDTVNGGLRAVDAQMVLGYTLGMFSRARANALTVPLSLGKMRW